MMTLVTGGSGSGKSAYAEEYITEISKDCTRYYLATMQIYDEEGQKKIARHRQMRSGKGFKTIEQPVNIEDALKKMTCVSENAVLLECISNLVANEMFTEDGVNDCETVTKKIVSGVQRLCEGVTHLVIVSNNVFEDGIEYDETTMEYIKTMGMVNQRLAKISDKVVEVVVGIPLVIKE